MTDPLHGILLVDKPEGLSSFKIVSIIRRKLAIKRVGHGGTLDPMATGLLVILLGKSTKLFDSLQVGTKTYEGTIVLGEARDSQDKTGQVTASIPQDEAKEKVRASDLEALRKSFLGPQKQKAPLYSALKHQGKPLYEYARKNIAVEAKEREVVIHSFDLKPVDELTLWFRAEVSKGTYLRSLAHDFGARLGTHAYLGSLRRTHSGRFGIEGATALDEIEKMTAEELRSKIIIDESLSEA